MRPRPVSLLCLALVMTASASWASLADIRPRPQQMGTLSAAPLEVGGAIYLVLADNITPVESVVRDEAVAMITAITGVSPIVLMASQWQGEGTALLLGTPERFPQLVDSLLGSGIPGLGVLTREEEYHLLVGTRHIFLCGKDHLAMEWGLLSLSELISMIFGNAYADRVYIRDWPDFPKRICTINSSVRNAEQYAYCDSLADMAYHCKMDEIEWNDSDGGDEPGPSFRVSSALAFRAKIARRGQFLTFGVDRTAYRVGQPSWQEGIPIIAMPMTVTSSGFVVSQNGVSAGNGGFENWTANVPDSWTMNPPASFATIARDNVNKHSGVSSIKWPNLDPTYPDGRHLQQRMYFGAHRLYKMKFWVKTSSFSGNVIFRIVGDAPVHNLYENSLVVPQSTANWTQYEVSFSTYHADTATLWIGPVGTAAGNLWLDDITLESVGFVRMVRRDDTPLQVFRQPGNVMMTEGVDYTVSEQSSSSADNYVYQPLLRRTANGGLPINSTVTVNWYTAMRYQYGREVECFSLLEPLQRYQRKIAVVDSLLKPEGFKIHINEVTYAGYDPTCVARGMTPGQLVGSYCDRMYDIIQARSPGAPVRIYGDAFDIFVNDPRCQPTQTPPWTVGSLQQLEPQIEVMAMVGYSPNIDSSLSYFNRNGHASVVAADGGTSWTRNYNAALAARRWPNCTGIIFFDWGLSRYTAMPDYSFMAWNLGPFFIHTPVEYTTRPDTSFLAVEIWSDSFRVNAPTQISSAMLSYRFDTGSTWTTVTPALSGPRTYSAAIVVPDGAASMQYYFTATDHRAQTRKLPPDAPERFFTANFPPTDPGEGWDPRRLDRSVRVRISGHLIEWEPVPDASTYEIHAMEYGGDVCRRNQTLIAVQPASQCRYFLDPDLFSHISPEHIVVIPRGDRVLDPSPSLAPK